MPGFDGTGPRGMGPLTGWGRGFCVVPISPNSSTYPEKGDCPPTLGVPGGTPYYGARQGTAGAGPFASLMTRKQELDFLKKRAQAMRGQLEQIEARIQQLVETGT
jgi:hypothetical protein